MIQFERVFEIIDSILELTYFTVEYEHRVKYNPFSEKFLNSSRTRVRINRLKVFLYDHIRKILRIKECGEQFYGLILRNYVKNSLHDLNESMTLNEKENPIYYLIFYRLNLDENFMLLSQLIGWEHQYYPFLLEEILIHEYEIHGNRIIDSDDILKYYIRFLDILTCSSIVSLFDLDALKYSISIDKEKFGKIPIHSSKLFTDWPDINVKPFFERFPQFKQRISEKIVSITPNQMNL